MNLSRFYGCKDGYLCRLDYDSSVIDEINKFCKNHSINTGIVKGIGALKNVTLGYYDQLNKKYIKKEINEPCEIVSLQGNISLKNGKIFSHLHISVATEKFMVYGGHLMAGTVYACELYINKFSNNYPFLREYDEETDLYLWK
jgi:predicted DNA-binding protein with PD1-like motif